MPEGDRTTALIELRHAQAQFTCAGERLRGEGFVDFDRVHFRQLPSGFLTETMNGKHRAKPHQCRIATHGT